MNKLKSTAFVLLMCIFMINHSYAQNLKFTLLHTSDEHAHLLPSPMVDYHPNQENPSLGGFARIASLIKDIKSEKSQTNEPVLVFSSGDYIGGTPFSWLILESYSPEIDIMQAVGYDAAMVGNHEFDYHPDVLAEYFKRAQYPEAHNKTSLIISNMIIPAGHVLNDIEFLENKIYELENGLKIGVFGILGELAYSVAPAAEPITIADPFEIAQKQTDRLKSLGADVVLAITHSGIDDDRKMAEQISGLDIIIGGHDHVVTTEPEMINNTIVFHSGYYLRNLGKLEFEFDPTNQSLSLRNDKTGSPYVIPVDYTIKEDPEIKLLVDEYTQNLNNFLANYTDSAFYDISKYVMYSDFPMIIDAPFKETSVGNFVTDAMRIMGEQISGKRVDFAFQGNGIIRGNIEPGTMDWSKNKVSFIDLVTIAGLGSGPDKRPGYPMVSFYLTEREVLNVLEISALLSGFMGDTYFLQISGLKYSYDPGKATWMKIPVLGTPIPAFKAVQKAELFTGEGIQDNSNDYKTLSKDGEQLYHIVSDYYLTSFLPMVGEMLPQLSLVLKDETGNPLELDNTILRNNGNEYKVWEAVAMYAQSFEKNPDGIAVAPRVYENTQERINIQKGTPLAVYSYTALILLFAGLGLGIRWIFKKIRKRKKN